MQKPAKVKRIGSGRPASGKAAKVSNLQRQNRQLYERLPELQLIYDTAPVGLAFLTLDCRYLQINQRLTEICGISVADHIGRSVRETVPRVADQVEKLVQAIARTGEPITGVEVRGQRADNLNADHIWITNWHPLKNSEGRIIGINVVAEDITERKRAEAVLAASENALRESEKRFRDLADNIDQFAWTADTDGRRNWFNKRWHDYAGTTLEEMQGFGWQKLHHPDHLERVVQGIRKSFKGDTPWEDTFPLRGRDGNYRWYLARALPIRNEAGEVVRWFGTNTDITEQLEAEKALRELNATLEHRVEAQTRERVQIWNVSQDLLVVTDLDGKYLTVNPAWTVSLGWSEAELLGNTSQWLLHPDDREKTRAEISQLAAGHVTQRFEVRFRHKDGSYRWLSWKAVQDHGRIYAMARDVTELKNAENKLRDVRHELSQAARRTTVAAMSAAIAHEIRQPLGAIVTNANAGLRWLNRPAPDLDEVRDTLTHIVADGHRASEVIQSVRAMFAKGDHAGTPLDTNELIRETIAIANNELEAARVVVELELGERIPMISAHKGQLQQVVLNIITNAADAMRTIDDRARVLRVRSRSFDSNGVAVSVQDSGTGIDPENIDRVFEAFFTTKTNGMGMGLAICRSIVEAHGGNMSVSPGVPHGSVFHIFLPGIQ
ncbi:MAG: PAS domain S-box protein [Pseudolabrys sp.]|jgi:PAS domain S-box-containing protein